MNVLPYVEEVDEECDIDHLFRVKNNSEDNPKIYEIRIKLSPIDDLVWKFLSATCECKGFTCKKTEECKHIKHCKEILLSHQKFT